MLQDVDETEPATRPDPRDDEDGRVAGSQRLAKFFDRLAVSPYPKAIVLYIAVRTFGTLILAGLADYHGGTLIDRLTAWDGQWYLRVAAHGYADLPGTLDAAQQPYADAPMAFFPLYPALTAALSWLGFDAVNSALLVSLLAGIVLACGLIRIGRSVSDGDRTGFLLVALWAGAPMAIVFSMVYTEALFCAFAVWALAGVLERRWQLAGLCTLGAGLCRSTAAVLVVVVVAAALIAAIRRPAERLSALVCALVAPLGIVGYLTFVGVRTGSWTGWQDIELRGWNTEFDFGKETWEYFVFRLTGNDSTFSTLTVLILLGAIALAIVAVRSRAPWPLTLYGVGVLLLVLGTRGLPDAKIRFILPAFPLLIPIAIGLSRRRLGTAVAVTFGWVLLGAWFSAHSLTAWKYAM